MVLLELIENRLDSVSVLNSESGFCWTAGRVNGQMRTLLNLDEEIFARGSIMDSSPSLKTMPLEWPKVNA